jgi:hypothetical protein
MPIAVAGATESLILAAGVLAVAAYFAWRQWVERRRRGTQATRDDAIHFIRQDARRFLGSVLMALVAVGLCVGTRIDVRAGPSQRLLFSATWLGVIALVGLLLILAMLDWLATRAYARRHRRALLAERLAVIEQERRRLAGRRDGRGEPDAASGEDRQP